MPRLELHPFDASHLDDAAALLASRHAAHRAVEPGLARAFERLEASREEVVALLAAGGTGAVASRRGAVVGYVLGTSRAEATWGPNVWVEDAGHAVDEPETIRDLYALAASRWVEEGRTSHFALVPASDPALVDAWFRVGFGQQHVHAVREAPPEPLTVAPVGVEIRRPGRDDIDALSELELALPAHQRLSPVFSMLPPESFDEVRAGWERDFDDPAYTTFVAVVDGRVVGSAIGCPVTLSGSNKGLIRPDDAGFLGFAAVRPEARGAGIGRALGARVLDWAGEAGYANVATDWRATNLLSSRTWPQLGWRPTFYRLFRAIA